MEYVSLNGGNMQELYEACEELWKHGKLGKLGKLIVMLYACFILVVIPFNVFAALNIIFKWID